jgi:SAM-dependent methyltransferase
VYDLFMTKEIPYDAWAEYITRLLNKHLSIGTNRNGKAPIILDLACGTGNITLRLAARGYDMIGVDASGDMLAQAQNKAFEQGHRVLWLAQDMRALDLYGTVDAAVCTCDGLNYILNGNELMETFRRVRLFLNPGGIFIFDMNTAYKFGVILGNGAFADAAEGAQYQWDNHYNPASNINTYRVTFQMGDEMVVGSGVRFGYVT